MKRRRLTSSVISGLAAVALAGWAPAPVGATPGDLDPTFGVGGALTTAFDEADALARAVVVQPGGEVVAAGRNGAQFALARYQADGRLEPGFGRGGKVLTSFSPSGGQSVDGECSGACFGDGAAAFALAQQSDGKLVTAGSAVIDAFGGFALARYLPDGSLDPTFGDGGKVTTDTPGEDARASAIVIQPDGKIVVAGHVLRHSFEFAIARYLSDGSLDPTFGDGGIAVTDVSGGTDQARALVLQPDGKLVAAGFVVLEGRFQFALVRYLPNGRPDTAFGQGGTVITSFPTGDAQAFSVALQPDGKLVALGGAVGVDPPLEPQPLFPPSSGSRHGGFALARYLPTGALDSGFGSTGLVTTSFQGGDAGGTSILLEADGRLVAAGFAHDGQAFKFALARYLATGAIDPSFGPGGQRTTSFAGGDSQVFAVAAQPDGKLVAAGFAREGERLQFALARYQSELLGKQRPVR